MLVQRADHEPMTNRHKQAFFSTYKSSSSQMKVKFVVDAFPLQSGKKFQKNFHVFWIIKTTKTRAECQSYYLYRSTYNHVSRYSGDKCYEMVSLSHTTIGVLQHLFMPKKTRILTTNMTLGKCNLSSWCKRNYYQQESSS